MTISKNRLQQLALTYHASPKPGKISMAVTKPMATRFDLALAYTPGVAAPCQAIMNDENAVFSLTARGNLVAVVTNGSAVLGLGNIGPLAAKPVMEGKAALFKKFAGIDSIDLEIKAETVEEMVAIISALEPSFGAINLEDIKAPECFEVERQLREKMGITVFHDDQHGTAIVVGAAVYNGLLLVGKKIEDVKLVSTGGGAAGIACLNLLTTLGLKSENVFLYDIHGPVVPERTVDMNPYKATFANANAPETLAAAMENADIFLGLSGPGVITQDMVASMAQRPLVLALANPTPEIMPEEVKAVRKDAIIASGRTDYPNQINNVLCFPFIFRAALDCGARDINHVMQIACVDAIAKLARVTASDVVANAYIGEDLVFGPDYILPKPFDPRLIEVVAPAVVEAAMSSGIASRPLTDMAQYKQGLRELVYRSGQTMRPLMERARRDRRRVVYAEGEDERVLRTAQAALDEGVAHPILIGRRAAIAECIRSLGLRMCPDKDAHVIEITRAPQFRPFVEAYLGLMGRQGVSLDLAYQTVLTNNTVFAALMVLHGKADAMICGLSGRYHDHLEQVRKVIGLRKDVSVCAAMNAIILEKGTFFIADTYVNYAPSAQEIAAIVVMAAEEVRRFGIEPKVALVASSNFGSLNTGSAQRLRDALDILWKHHPNLEVEGEMHADSALSAEIRDRIYPNNHLKGAANLLVAPSADAANIAFNMVKVLGNGLNVGPILLGLSRAVNVVTPSITAHDLLNMTAVAVVEAQLVEARQLEGVD